MSTETKKVYLKLGSGSTLFVDQRNQFSITGPEVIEVNEEQLGSKAFAASKKAGHVVDATAAEFSEWTKKNNKDIKDSQKNPNQSMSNSNPNNDAPVDTGKSTLSGLAGAGEDADELAEVDDDDDTDVEEMTKSELIDALKDSDYPKADQNKLTGLNKAELVTLHKKHVK